MDPDKEIHHEFFSIIRLYRSGRIERLIGTDAIPASLDPAIGVTSKDVTINPSTGVSARLYLLANTKAKRKLPILVFFHGDGFCVQSAFFPTYAQFLNSLAAQANLLLVSIDYRLVPEHPVPMLR